jgi:hypothetical protein
MIENVMNKIGGVGIFGLISICIFFAFFTGMLVWSICLKKNYLVSMQKLPLDEDTASPNRVNPQSEHRYE